MKLHNTGDWYTIIIPFSLETLIKLGLNLYSLQGPKSIDLGSV